MVSRPAVASSATGTVRALRQHQRQRPRPERRGERLRGGVETGERACGRELAHMGDQRVECGPSLGGVEPGDRRPVGGVGAQAVDGLGRERDEAAGRRARGRPRRSRRARSPPGASPCRGQAACAAASTASQSRLVSFSMFCSRAKMRSMSRAAQWRVSSMNRSRRSAASSGPLGRALEIGRPSS